MGRCVSSRIVNRIGFSGHLHRFQGSRISLLIELLRRFFQCDGMVVDKPIRVAAALKQLIQCLFRRHSAVQGFGVEAAHRIGVENQLQVGVDGKFHQGIVQRLRRNLVLLGCIGGK